MEKFTSGFKGQTAVITGGAQGIGKAVAERLALGGARVVLWDLDLDLATETAKALGGTAVRASVEDWQSVSQALATTLAASDRIDILVNSAGIAGSNAPLADYDVEEFRRIVEIKLGAVKPAAAVVVVLVRRWADDPLSRTRDETQPLVGVSFLLVQRLVVVRVVRRKVHAVDRRRVSANRRADDGDG